MYQDLERRRIYWVHAALKRRCSPRAKPGDKERYYERGITVCDRWLGEGGFARFLADMGFPPADWYEIDRINNDGDYTPDNCRWVTHAEQHENKRRRADAVPEDICTLIVSAVLSGASYRSVADQFDIHPATASKITYRWLDSLQADIE